MSNDPQFTRNLSSSALPSPSSLSGALAGGDPMSAIRRTLETRLQVVRQEWTSLRHRSAEMLEGGQVAGQAVAVVGTAWDTLKQRSAGVLEVNAMGNVGTLLGVTSEAPKLSDFGLPVRK